MLRTKVTGRANIAIVLSLCYIFKELASKVVQIANAANVTSRLTVSTSTVAKVEAIVATILGIASDRSTGDTTSAVATVEGIVMTVIGNVAIAYHIVLIAATIAGSATVCSTRATF